MKFTLVQNLKYAVAVVGICFGWWMMSFGLRLNARGIAFTSWAEQAAVGTGLESAELVWRAEEAEYGPLTAHG